MQSHLKSIHTVTHDTLQMDAADDSLDYRTWLERSLRLRSRSKRTKNDGPTRKMLIPTSCWLQRSLLESNVQSTFAIFTYGLPTNFTPSSSHVGANLLQWPHLKQKQSIYIFNGFISCSGYSASSKMRGCLCSTEMWRIDTFFCFAINKHVQNQSTIHAIHCIIMKY